jgi:hypothetical protein
LTITLVQFSVVHLVLLLPADWLRLPHGRWQLESTNQC